MRSQLDFTLYCSKHPKVKLEINHKESSIGASSAYEANIKMVVEPCQRCQNEMYKIKDSINNLYEFIDKEKIFTE